MHQAGTPVEARMADIDHVASELILKPQMEPTEKTDVFSVAVSLYSALTGKVSVFESGDILWEQLVGAPSFEDEIGAENVSPLLRDVKPLLNRALSVNANERPTAAKFRDELIKIAAAHKAPITEEVEPSDLDSVRIDPDGLTIVKDNLRLLTQSTHLGEPPAAQHLVPVEPDLDTSGIIITRATYKGIRPQTKSQSTGSLGLPRPLIKEPKDEKEPESFLVTYGRRTQAPRIRKALGKSGIFVINSDDVGYTIDTTASADKVDIMATIPLERVNIGGVVEGSVVRAPYVEVGHVGLGKLVVEKAGDIYAGGSILFHGVDVPYYGDTLSPAQVEIGKGGAKEVVLLGNTYMEVNAGTIERLEAHPGVNKIVLKNGARINEIIGRQHVTIVNEPAELLAQHVQAELRAVDEATNKPQPQRAHPAGRRLQAITAS